MHRRIHGLHAGLIPGKGRPIQSYLSAVIPCNSPGNVLFTMTIAPLLGLTWTENSFFLYQERRQVGEDDSHFHLLAGIDDGSSPDQPSSGPGTLGGMRIAVEGLGILAVYTLVLVEIGDHGAGGGQVDRLG